MNFSRAQSAGPNQILGYGKGEILIGETTYTSNILVSSQTLISDWGPPSIDELTSHHVLDWIRQQPQIVVLGTGATQVFPGPEVLFPLMEEQIGCEVMATDAACRTFNLLMGEGRNVLAALFV